MEALASFGSPSLSPQAHTTIHAPPASCTSCTSTHAQRCPHIAHTHFAEPWKPGALDHMRMPPFHAILMYQVLLTLALRSSLWEPHSWARRRSTVRNEGITTSPPCSHQALVTRMWVCLGSYMNLNGTGCVMEAPCGGTRASPPPQPAGHPWQRLWFEGWTRGLPWRQNRISTVRKEGTATSPPCGQPGITRVRM